MTIDRRSLVGAALLLGVAPADAATPRSLPPVAGPIALSDLPWRESALEPALSGRGIGFHYNVIQRRYVEATNRLIAGTDYADMPLIEIVEKSARDTARAALAQNSAQVWNHDFYWRSLAPKSGGAPGTQLSGMIGDAFGSYDGFRVALHAAADALFASSYVWLVYRRRGKKLALMPSADAGTPLGNADLLPLAVLDLWEHAYYLDYPASRKDYVEAVLNRLLNWRFVEQNLSRA